MTETETEKQKEGHTERRERERERKREREKEREREREREAGKERQTDRQSDRDSGREGQRVSERGREAKRRTTQPIIRTGAPEGLIVRLASQRPRARGLCERQDPLQVDLVVRDVKRVLQGCRVKISTPFRCFSILTSLNTPGALS